MTADDAPESNTDEDLAVFPAADPALANLVAMVNAAPSDSLSLTVLTPAGAVSGIAISGVEWMRSQAARLEGGGVAATGYSKMFNNVADLIADDIEATDIYIPRFVHFKDARLVTGGDAAPGFDSPGGFWRVAMKDVSGWMVGVLDR